MSFKTFFFKKIVPAYCIIVTLINIGMMTVGPAFFPQSRFGFEAFRSPLIFGALGCLPVLMDYFFEQRPQSRTTILVQTFTEWALLECCIIGGAFLMKMKDIQSPVTVAVLFIMVLVIFAAVSAVGYYQDDNTCRELNKALRMRQGE